MPIRAAGGMSVLSRWVRNRWEGTIYLLFPFPGILGAPLGIRQYICLRWPFSSKNLPFIQLTQDHRGDLWHGYTCTYTQLNTDKGAADEFTYERYIGDPWGMTKERGGRGLMKPRQQLHKECLLKGGIFNNPTPSLTYANMKLTKHFSVSYWITLKLYITLVFTYKGTLFSAPLPSIALWDFDCARMPQ